MPIQINWLTSCGTMFDDDVIKTHSMHVVAELDPMSGEPRGREAPPTAAASFETLADLGRLGGGLCSGSRAVSY